MYVFTIFFGNISVLGFFGGVLVCFAFVRGEKPPRFSVKLFVTVQYILTPNFMCTGLQNLLSRLI